MICQGIYPYRSNSWRIFSHWIEKRISPPPPPHPIQPVTGDTHSFSCVVVVGGGEGRNSRKKSLLPKSKRYPLFIPSDLSQPSSYRYSVSLFFFNFSVWPVLRGKEDEARTNGSSLLHVQASLIQFYSEKNSSCRPSSKHWVNVRPLSDDVEVFQQFLGVPFNC